MDFCSREKAIERINALGAQERPFLFVIDYSTEHSYVSLLEDINPDEVLYSFPSWSNDSAELERYGVESVIQSKRTQSMSSMPIKIHEMPAYESPAHESQRMETRSREVQNSDTQSGEVCDKVIWEAPAGRKQLSGKSHLPHPCAYKSFVEGDLSAFGSYVQTLVQVASGVLFT